MEQWLISGVTHDEAEAKVTIEQVPDRPGIAAKIFRDLAEAGINVDMIVQNGSSGGHTDISFTVPRPDVDRTARCMEKIVVDPYPSAFPPHTHLPRLSPLRAPHNTPPRTCAPTSL